mgnify:CR=1 FL=1
MMSWAKPGVKCVCVDDKPRRIPLFTGSAPVEVGGVYPVRGEVYTIQAVEWHESPLHFVGSFLGVHLVEINRPPGRLTGNVVPYRIERFRPLVTKTMEEDVTLFAPLLRQKTPIDA